MIKFIFKKIFWCNYDFIVKNALFSLLWILFNTPVFFLLGSLILTKNYNVNLYIIIYNFLWFSPFTVGLFYATKYMVNLSYSESKKIFNFFKGIKLFWKKSLIIYFFHTLFLLIIYNSFIFYANKRLGLPYFIQFLFAGLIFWIFIYYIFMQINFFPILVHKNGKVFDVFYKSFLLVLDNFWTHFLFFLFFSSSLIISAFSVLGFIFIFPAFYSLSINIFTLSLWSKYNKEIVVEKETRTLKNLIKPWE